MYTYDPEALADLIIRFREATISFMNGDREIEAYDEHVLLDVHPDDAVGEGPFAFRVRRGDAVDEFPAPRRKVSALMAEEQSDWWPGLPTRRAFYHLSRNGYPTYKMMLARHHHESFSLTVQPRVESQMARKAHLHAGIYHIIVDIIDEEIARALKEEPYASTPAFTRYALGKLCRRDFLAALEIIDQRRYRELLAEFKSRPIKVAPYMCGRN